MYNCLLVPLRFIYSLTCILLILLLRTQFSAASYMRKLFMQSTYLKMVVHPSLSTSFSFLILFDLFECSKYNLLRMPFQNPRVQRDLNVLFYNRFLEESILPLLNYITILLYFHRFSFFFCFIMLRFILSYRTLWAICIMFVIDDVSKR